ncbi:MAG: putative manganese transporter [bacterium]
MELLTHNLNHSLMITAFVFVMMMLVDYIEVLTQGKMSSAIKGGYGRQYVIASFLASTPGCLGEFMNVSFYVHGLLTFGAITGSMIATSGDEAFVMLAIFPKQALILFGILFILGIVSAWAIDKIAPILRIKPSQVCELSKLHLGEEGCKILDLKGVLEHFRKMAFYRFLLLALLAFFIYGSTSGIIGPKDWNWLRITFIFLVSLAIFMVITVPDHYLEKHIWNHIVKEHMWRVFLWTFFALLVVDVGLKFWNLEAFVHRHMFWVLLIASLIGIVPESGPHLIFVMMFANGLIPFSVLLASSVVQDGHGMLPLLSYTIKDSLLIKLFNFIIGLICGLILYIAGL